MAHSTPISCNRTEQHSDIRIGICWLLHKGSHSFHQMNQFITDLADRGCVFWHKPRQTCTCFEVGLTRWTRMWKLWHELLSHTYTCLHVSPACVRLLELCSITCPAAAAAAAAAAADSRGALARCCGGVISRSSYHLSYQIRALLLLLVCLFVPVKVTWKWQSRLQLSLCAAFQTFTENLCAHTSVRTETFTHITATWY